MKKGDKAMKLFSLILLTIAILPLIAGVASAEPIIIDTEKGVPGFWTEPARDLPANWQYIHDHPDTSADGWFDTNAYPPGQGNGSFWYTISFPDLDECKGIWETSVPYTGKYEVFAWIPSPDPFDPYLDEATPPSDYLPTKRAQYKIFHNDGVATVTIDQNVNRGGFTSLGVFEFDSTARVELSSNGVEFWRCVAFDAVTFVPVVHDMAVTDVFIMPPSVSVGRSTAICVTVTNEGSQQEANASVKAFVDGAQVGSTQYVSLDPGASDTTTFLWIPRAAKNYSVEGEVGVVGGETDTDDNRKAIGVRVPSALAPVTTPSPATTPTLTPTQLANSPWPMFHHDLKHSGRSPFAGPETSDLKWSFASEHGIDTSPAIGSDGTVYLSSGCGELYAINSNGSLNWSYTTTWMVGTSSSPAICTSGIIYLALGNYNLYAINPDGSLKWIFPTGATVYSSPAIGIDGTIYVGSCDSKLYAINPNGSLKWSFTADNWIYSSPAIDPDGTIYFGSYKKLYAVNSNGSIKWDYDISGWASSSPAIDATGTVYFTSNDGNLYAMNADGTFKWSYNTGAPILSSPALGADGTIYIGSTNGKLYAITDDGSLKWSFATGDAIWASSPAIDATGTIYVGSCDHKLYAINADGSLKWNFEVSGRIYRSSPSIDSDGTIYVGSDDGKLYAIGKKESPPELQIGDNIITTVYLHVRNIIDWNNPLDPNNLIFTMHPPDERINPPYDVGKIIDGPKIDDQFGYTWWKIEWDNGEIGWSAEGPFDNPAERWLVKTNKPFVKIQDLEDPFNYQYEYELNQTELRTEEKKEEVLQNVMKYAKVYKISPALIMAIIRQESDFDANAMGDFWDGEYHSFGYMQVSYNAATDTYKEYTGDEYKGTEEQWKTDGLDPETNIKYGVRYLRIQHDRIKDGCSGYEDVYADILKSTISAYNAGHPTLANRMCYVLGGNCNGGYTGVIEGKLVGGVHRGYMFFLGNRVQAVPAGTIKVSLNGNVDDATKNWNYPTKYNAPVFRRGVDNPAFILTLDGQLPADYECFFEIYSPNDANPIGSKRSSSVGCCWNWADENGNPLNKNQIPIGIYTVKGYLVKKNNPEDKKFIGSDEFYVIFDFARMDDGAFTSRVETISYKWPPLLPRYWTERLHQYDHEIWMRAVDWTNGNITIQEAVNSIAKLTRTVNGDSTYHHIEDNEMVVFVDNGYDDNFNGIPDPDSTEKWHHNYETSLWPIDPKPIYIKDLGKGIGDMRIPVFLHEKNGEYWSSSKPTDLVDGSNYHDVKDFVKSDIRPYKAPQGKEPLEPQLASWHPHPIGLCEDYAMLSTAYLRCIGIPAKVVSGWPLVIGAGHTWTWYYNNDKWHHLDTDYEETKNNWEKYRYEWRHYLTSSNSYVDHVYTEKYENEHTKKEDVTNRYKPNLHLKLLSYNPNNGELKIEAEYPAMYDEELKLTGEYTVLFSVSIKRIKVYIEAQGLTTPPLAISPGETKTATFTVATSISPIYQIDYLQATAHVRYPGSIPIGTSPWTPASSIWQAAHSASMETMENKHTTQIENPNETINCSIVNMEKFEPGRTSPVTVSINNTGDQNATINIAFGMQTAEPVIGVIPTAILVGNKSAIEINGHTIKEVPINVSVPNYFSPGLYKLILAPYNDTGIMYMRNYTVNITANYDINSSKPENVTIGVPFNFAVSIKNKDTEPICNITTKLNLHYCFNTTESLAQNISQLNPDETHTFSWNLTPIDYGELGLDVEIYSDAGCELNYVDINTLSTAKLWITPETPEKVKKGNNFILNATVFNSGDIPSDNVTLNITTPENVTANRTCVELGIIGAHENKTCSFRIFQNESRDFMIPLNATSSNATATRYAFIEINEPPIANFTYLPLHPVVNHTVIFNASNSTDPDGNITKYDWNFGDGNITNTTEEIINHTYSLAGDYLVNLTVTDNDGAMNSTEKTITVYLTVPPEITSFAPPSQVNDTICTWRTFNVTVNQTVNVSWYLNGTFQFTNESVREAKCTLHAAVAGEHNVTANASNANGTDMQTWVWNVAASKPPEITLYAPESHVNDTEGATRSFNITINQTVNVSWQINGSVVQTDINVTEASYTNTSAVVGTWNVSAIVNNANGTDMQTWVWTVEPSPCFIATAAYGTALHEDINVLRDFRDEYLMTNPPGRTFVKIYYTSSPPLANVIRDNEGLRTTVRVGLVKPLVYVTRMFV